MKPAAILLLAVAAAAAPPSPRVLLTAGEFDRIARLAAAEPWAAAARSAVLTAAEAWPAAQVQRYGLGEWSLPPEGGQWSQWYVCPTHGVSLEFRLPAQHVCPIDNRAYSGWPYEQVIYGRRHSDNAAAARDNGLAYRFTGKPEYARAAARILLAYADVYSGYRIKDVNNRETTASGARVTAQTLDESVWLIPIAWAYDLIADSGALDSAQRERVERDLLRPAAAVIARYDARMSNWQSWHNAAIGAVGFALDDAPLIARAIDGPSGFRYQMRASVLGDGLWYEGAWGYHFYALDPLVQLAEMAARNGIDLWAEPPLRGMFASPLLFAMPDGSLAPFNDSRVVDLAGYARLYEVAYARCGDPTFAHIAGRRARGRESLFWGAEALPEGARLELGSAVFPDSGNAVLRAAGSDHFLAVKFGPHGGGHGHNDKLGMVSYARGGIMAVDPGTQSYAAPSHNTWDKITVSHNTVVVDEKTQAAATGELLAFAALPGVSAVRAGAGPVYRQAALERSLILTAEYAVDLFDSRSTDGAPHRFDWIYHNYGKLAADLPLEPYTAFPRAEGYQHLSGARAAATGEDWQASFDMNAAAGAYGSTYVSPSTVGATYRYSREQSAGGAYSGRLGYDFTRSQGYVVFQAPAPARQEAPLSVSFMVWGDGSGHRLAIRLYDSTDERFVHTIGPVSWRGWRLVSAAAPERWNHYLGNNDGVFDAPLKTFGIELTSVAGGPLEGALYVDDFEVEYPSGRSLLADWERTLRNLRLWMAGAPETTVVAGEGLGPDLRVPVPFAMARRTAAATRFAALLEPYGEAPLVTAFRAGDTIEIEGAGFADRIRFDSGVLSFIRRDRGVPVRLALAGAAALEDGGQTLIALETPAAVQVDFGPGGETVAVAGDLRGALRIYAPAAHEAWLNGQPAAFDRDGDYIVLAVPPPAGPAAHLQP